MAHLDIKPDNIVLTDELGLEFIDLAWAKPAYINQNGWCTTINYAPPEVLKEDRRSKGTGPPYEPFPVDIFTLGATLYIILFQRPPFGISEQQPNYKIDARYNYLWTERGKSITDNLLF